MVIAVHTTEYFNPVDTGTVIFIVQIVVVNHCFYIFVFFCVAVDIDIEHRIRQYFMSILCENVQ
jgi:hypothetical protein